MAERHPGNGNGISTLPVWVRAAAIVGIPGVIAFFLVWVGANDIPRMVRTLETLRLEVLYNRKLMEAQAVQSERAYRLQQRICANAARDNIERARCFD